MPSIDALITAPVIHTTRPDGALLTAIRVPTNDVRLDRWGWTLYSSQKDSSDVSSAIETLTDHTGQRYPKIYTLSEVKAYATKWGAADRWGNKEIDWKPGYWDADPWGEIFYLCNRLRKKSKRYKDNLPIHYKP